MCSFERMKQADGSIWKSLPANSACRGNDPWTRRLQDRIHRRHHPADKAGHGDKIPNRAGRSSIYQALGGSLRSSCRRSARSRKAIRKIRSKRSSCRPRSTPMAKLCTASSAATSRGRRKPRNSLTSSRWIHLPRPNKPRRRHILKTRQLVSGTGLPGRVDIFSPTAFLVKSLLATTIAALACSCTASAEEPVARQAAAILAAGGGPVFADWKSRPGSNSARPLLKPIIHLAYSSDGRRLAQGTSSGVVTIWDVANEQEAAHFEADCNQQIAFARNGVTVRAAGYKGAYHLWEAKSGEEYRQIAGKFGTLALNESGCAAFSPDLDEVALGAADGQVRILATASGDA